MASLGRSDLPAPDIRGVSDRLLTAICDVALAHRVGGCVHQVLGTSAAADGPLAVLAAERWAATSHHLTTVRTLRAVGRALDDAGVPWLVMKGPVLAAHVYGDPGLRTSGDLDLLVPRSSFAAAVGALEAAGWSLLFRNWPLIWRARAGELPLGDDGGRLVLDLHWHLTFGEYDRRHLALDPAVLFERARTVVVGGMAVPTLDPVDTLLHVAFHAAHSGGDRLVWLKDVERVLAREEPDLDELVRRSEDAGCAFGVGLALDRARRVLDAQVPREVVARLLPADLRLLDRALTGRRRLTGPSHRGSVGSFVAGSLLDTRRRSVVRLGGVAVDAGRRRLVPHRHLDEHDPDRPDSPTHAAGTRVDRERYLAWVSGP